MLDIDRTVVTGAVRRYDDTRGSAGDAAPARGCPRGPGELHLRRYPGRPIARRSAAAGASRQALAGEALTVAQPGRVVQGDPAWESQIPSHPQSLSQTDLTPQALLAAIVASSDDAIISKTLEGIITSWNEGAERLFGYTAAEAIGRSVLLIIPDDRKSEEEMILSRLRRGERTDHFETVRVTKDGRLLDISLTISPICDEAGQLIGRSEERRVGKEGRDRRAG